MEPSGEGTCILYGLCHAYEHTIFNYSTVCAWNGAALVLLSLSLSQGLAAFLKAIGYLIPLMDSEMAFRYTQEVMVILIRQFQSPDEEMKKIVLKVRTCTCESCNDSEFVECTCAPCVRLSY